jgi:hypothetical protein
MTLARQPSRDHPRAYCVVPSYTTFFFLSVSIRSLFGRFDYLLLVIVSGTKGLLRRDQSSAKANFLCWSGSDGRHSQAISYQRHPDRARRSFASSSSSSARIARWRLSRDAVDQGLLQEVQHPGWRVLQRVGKNHGHLLPAGIAGILQQLAQGVGQAKSSQSWDGFKWMVSFWSDLAAAIFFNRPLIPVPSQLERGASYLIF